MRGLFVVLHLLVVPQLVVLTVALLDAPISLGWVQKCSMNFLEMEGRIFSVNSTSTP